MSGIGGRRGHLWASLLLLKELTDQLPDDSTTGYAPGDTAKADHIVRQMRADGLVETLPWEHSPRVASDKRAELARRLSHGKPLSQVIIESRKERA